MTPTLRAGQGASAAQRRGFTLAELVVALLLFSLIGGTIMTVVMRQQRFYRSTADIIQLQGQLRQGASLLPLDLRMVSTSDTLVNGATTKYNADIYSMNDWSIEFRRGFGSSLICAKRTAVPLDTITLYPKASDSTAALSSWGITPVLGDSVLILDERSLLGQGDDVWVAYEVRAVTPVTGIRGCPWKGQIADIDPVTAGSQPDLSPLLYPADTVRQSFKLALDRAVPQSVMVGAPVRFFRRVRYEIYQAGDQQWYLGYSDCLRTYGTWNECSEVTPVSGPFAPYTGVTTENGFVLAYYDSLGNPLASTAQPRLVSRVEVLMRGQTSRNVTQTGGGAGAVRRDSLILSVGIRNRR